jgi:hypothetical protein
VMSRYSVYNANQLMTRVAATSMISKNNTTGASLFVPSAFRGPVWPMALRSH